MIQQQSWNMHSRPQQRQHAPVRIGGLHGVRHMQFTTTGGVYWKGIYLKQLDVPFDPSHTLDIQALGKMCLHLENIGVPVNSRTAVTYANWFSDMTDNEPYKAILARCPSIHISRDKLLLVFKRSAAEMTTSEKSYYHLPSKSSLKYSPFLDANELEKRGYTTWLMKGLNLEDLRYCFDHFQVPPDLFSHMSDVLNPPWR